MKLDDCFNKGYLKRTVPDIESAKRSLVVSSNNLHDAEANLSIGRYRIVLISSYTAMFHAARALLFRDGVKERSHECIPFYIKAKIS